MSTRLRAINGAQRPQSSMGTGPSPVTRNYRDESRDERSNKRRKAPELSNASLSRHFTSNTHSRPLEVIEDDGPISSKHTQPIHDLTREVSQAISLDGSSVTSNSKTAAATSGLLEYRNVHSHNAVKSGRRRRKPSSTKPTFSPIDLDDTSAVKHKNLPPPPPSSHTAASPDHLATVFGEDPPLTNITSDIVYQSKRQAPEYAQSTAKRYKLANSSQNSDDELSRPGTSAGREPGKKPTNFPKLISQSSSQSRPQRGDIQSTFFKPTAKSVAERRNLAQNEPKWPDPIVIGAACGKFTYPPGNSVDKHIQLRLGSNTAFLTDQERQEFSWLEVRKRTVQSVKQNNTNSPTVIVYRSVVDQASSPLALKFSSEINASFFIQWLQSSSAKFEPHSASYLEKIFNKAVQNAENHEEQQVKQDGLASPNNTHKTTLSGTQPLSPTEQHVSASSNNDDQINPPRPQPRPSHRDPFMGEPRSPGPGLVPESKHRPTKLKDGMQGLHQPKEGVHRELSDTEDAYAALSRTRRPETRRTRRSSPPSYRQRTPDTWTAQNPGWDKDWHRSLVYPPTGKNRATVDKDDIQRLDEGEFLNDNLISFYLRYLQVQLEKKRPEILEKVYIFNTFFFEKLRSNRAKINYDGVKAWTARIDLLSYEYIVVPVNENAHWYLAIIYNAPRLLPQEDKAEASVKKESPNPQEPIIVEDNDPAVSISDGLPTEQTPSAVSGDVQIPRSTRSRTVNGNGNGNGNGGAVPNDETVTNAELPVRTNKRKSTGGNQKFSTDEPRIITLDSLGAAHSPTCKCLRDYLVEEARHKKGIEITNLPGGMTARNIPEQDNYCDCGVFILGYMEHFLKDPDEAVRKLLHKEATNWDINAPKIRAKVRDLLFEFQQEQHVRLEEEKEKKRQRRATKGPVSSPQVAPSSPQVPQKEPETPQVKRGLKSPLTNGTNNARQEEPRQAGTISAYFEVVSPERRAPERPAPETLAQPQTPQRNEEPPLVRPLEDDSSNESKASSSGEVFHSARSSPVNSVPRVFSNLTTERHLPRDGQTTPRQLSTPDFVNKLSVSSNDDTGPPTASSTIRKNSSPVDLTKEHHPSPPTARGGEGVVDLRSIIIESIEDDNPPSKGPHYDGIDRSIDLTAI